MSKKYFALFLLLFFTYNSMADEAASTALLCARVEKTDFNSNVGEITNNKVTPFKEFVQFFFTDSIYQHEHVSFPLLLEVNEEDESSFPEDSILIKECEYLTLILDPRSVIKTHDNVKENPYIIVSIPDTALEAELYFQKINEKYFLTEIKITGDASPFLNH